ncbi:MULTISPECIES: hypothetical protein [unclassified Polynucleobacter]|jgi:hypothetical protein|uniref:hypothetical protein n=1 Tax=unclassified Polynucleobacter TaxID=2640945 RepID=UPI000BDAC4A7|nr:MULTISPECIES: hypothetical protein [unclassified Polynucleobacter]OYY21391.1 MAG: hypothetical protein B7Y67_01955 [Polynucleobacter sp. 35-46-11]OZA78174.1 MAG: hypothetical protein B7X71_02020 [Polynucleobacter sp. 39-46-10]
MSKHETHLTRRYWESIGGTLVEEFPAVARSKDNAQRLLDGVVILGEKTQICKAYEVDVKDKDIVVIQTKANRVGMNLLGQAVFSAELMKSHKPKSIKAVAICTLGDSVLEPLASKFGIEVIIYEEKS